MIDTADLGTEKMRPAIPLRSHATAATPGDGITTAKDPQTAAVIKCDYFCLELTDPRGGKQKNTFEV